MKEWADSDVGKSRVVSYLLVRTGYDPSDDHDVQKSRTPRFTNSETLLCRVLNICWHTECLQSVIAVILTFGTWSAHWVTLSTSARGFCLAFLALSCFSQLSLRACRVITSPAYFYKLQSFLNSSSIIAGYELFSYESSGVATLHYHIHDFMIVSKSTVC
jgi:hypothetical protein